MYTLIETLFKHLKIITHLSIWMGENKFEKNHREKSVYSYFSKDKSNGS